MFSFTRLLFFLSPFLLREVFIAPFLFEQFGERRLQYIGLKKIDFT